MTLRRLLGPALAAFALVLCAAAGLAQGVGSGVPDSGQDDAASVTQAGRSRESETGNRESELAGPVKPELYRLGPGDRLILVFRGPVTQDLTLEVEPEGTLMVPSDSLLYVAGRTLAEVREDVLRRVRRHYRGVQIQLRLSRPRTFRVYLTGQVEEPGPVRANGSYRVADVLTPEMLIGGASRRNIQVIRASGESERCDLDLFLQTGRLEWNPWLQDGDVIQVPSATRFVRVEGAVARPGRYELGQRDSARTLLRLAGDPLPAAELERMLIVRFAEGSRPESLWFSVPEIVSGSSNPAIDDGERLFVFFRPKYRELFQATILGEVGRPGTYPIDEGHTSLRDLVQSAGGILPTADLSTLRVHRAATLTAGKDPELDRLLRLPRGDLTASEYEVLRTRLARLREDYSVDWNRLQSDPALDLKVRDGDVASIDRPLLAIRVDGEVHRPGLINFVPGQGWQDYLRQAGGPTNRAWRGKIRITRVVTGQTLLARDVRALDPGDFVWVPERPDVTVWERVKDVLVASAQAATIIIAIRSVQ